MSFRILVCIILTLSFKSFALAESETIHIIAGLAKPPFIVEEGKSGMQMDIIQAALSSENILVNFSHMPFGRLITGFQQWNIDGISTLPPNYKYPGLYTSKPYITYENVAITLQDNDIKLDSVTDLQGRSVVAFQNAKKFITGDYKLMVPNIIDYRELPEQNKQVQMLFTGRTEVIVLDVNIFKYAVRTSEDPAYKKKYKVHHIFDLRHYAAGFKSKGLKEKFDRGIQLIKDNGTYQNILDKYLNK
ncbi:amino acid ABC transporter substrate-binding protein [Thalassotalea sp. M1531]|uniref:Amino acid ABC transporter substrate-binding protein n=1 Tax=Thalassotalea algicola TaxID=2716224 RepID=A0A7Y0Q7P9_9GAMM|nr:transporter substrate-binding domain-containing protein [Thalassotalea algicola]NMP32628.1 amino acid ABC transporter substrate-binding protein [Thalassotalea algicola]